MFLKKTKTLETPRLLLRPWRIRDAKECYRYARNPNVGPRAGWPAHRSVAESRQIIRTYLSGPHIFAIVLKETGLPIGSIGLQTGEMNHASDRPDECELGFWIGEPYWGQGIMVEAAKAALRYAFTDMGMTKVWCGYYEGNEQSASVQRKLGFRYERTDEDVLVQRLKERRTEIMNSMTREQWEEGELTGAL